MTRRKTQPKPMLVRKEQEKIICIDDSGSDSPAVNVAEDDVEPKLW